VNQSVLNKQFIKYLQIWWS